MTNMTPDDSDLQRAICTWYERSQPDYIQMYLNLFIAYATWFKRVTGSKDDFEGIKRLKKRFVLWNDYCEGRIMRDLLTVMDRISRHLVSLRGTEAKNIDRVVVNDSKDWRGLIDFWYAVRCDIIHGHHLPGEPADTLTVQLAYESLHIFMSEIITRMRQHLGVDELEKLELVRELAETRYRQFNSCEIDSSERAESLRLYQEMRQKYQILSRAYLLDCDPWTVDAQDVEYRGQLYTIKS